MLAANVLVTLISDLRPVLFVGGFVSATNLVALLCNVTVLPAILTLTLTLTLTGTGRGRDAE